MSGGTVERVNPATAPFGAFYLGRDTSDGTNMDGAWIWDTAVPQGATILTCTVMLDNGGGDNLLPLTGAWWGFDVDTPSDFSASDTHRISDHHTRTTATVTDNINTNGDHTSPSLVSIAQEIVDRAGFSGRIGLTWRNAAGSGTSYYEFSDYSDGSTLAALLDITWQTDEISRRAQIVRARVPIHQLRI